LLSDLVLVPIMYLESIGEVIDSALLAFIGEVIRGRQVALFALVPLCFELIFCILLFLTILFCKRYIYVTTTTFHCSPRRLSRVLAAWSCEWCWGVWFDREGSRVGGPLGCHWHARLNWVGLGRWRRNLTEGICNKIE
jgi:hypothetical protein